MTDTEKILKRLDDLAEVSALACLLFDYQAEDTNANIVEQVKKWINEPNEFLFGDSPKDVCMRGESDVLKQWLRDKLGL